MADELEQGDDYLIAPTDKNVLQNLSKMGSHLKALKVKMVEAEAVYEAAKKEYDYYANSVLPMEMYNAGVSTLELMDGGILRYERKFYCTPNKNEADKKKIADWLRANGGEFLIKERAAVDAAQIPLLVNARVPFTEICDFNTNSLKAFLKDKLGAGGGLAQITPEQIPAEIHFQEQGMVTIEA